MCWLRCASDIPGVLGCCGAPQVWVLGSECGALGAPWYPKKAPVPGTEAAFSSRAEETGQGWLWVAFPEPGLTGIPSPARSTGILTGLELDTGPSPVAGR